MPPQPRPPSPIPLKEKIDLPGEQWQILAALAELYQSRGKEARAREALGQAAKIIQALAAKIDDESLRTGFLAAESVRRVFTLAGAKSG